MRCRLKHSGRSCSLAPHFTVPGFSEVEVKGTERVACAFANLVDKHRVANVGVLGGSEFRFLAHRGDRHEAPVANRVVGAVFVVHVVEVITELVGHNAPRLGHKWRFGSIVTQRVEVVWSILTTFPHIFPLFPRNTQAPGVGACERPGQTSPPSGSLLVNHDLVGATEEYFTRAVLPEFAAQWAGNNY
jgi:hypothetical protein